MVQPYDWYFSENLNPNPMPNYLPFLFPLLLVMLPTSITAQQSGVYIGTGLGANSTLNGGGDAGLAVDLEVGYEIPFGNHFGVYGAVGVQRHEFSRIQIVNVDFSLDSRVVTETGHRVVRGDAIAKAGVKTYWGRLSLGAFLQWSQLIGARIEGYRTVESDRSGVNSESVELFSGAIDETVDGVDGAYRGYLDNKSDGLYGLEVDYRVTENILIGVRASHTLGLTYLTVEAPDCDGQGNCGPPVAGDFATIDHARGALELIGRYRF